MNSRVKLNDTETHRKTYARNDLYRQFTPAFTQLFSANPLSIEYHNPSAGYVVNKGIEEGLQSFADSFAPNICEFIGETGIGKSTYIRKVFGVKANPSIDGDVLKIPFYMNGKDITQDNYKKRFLKQLRAAFNLVAEKYEVLQDLDNDDLFDFINDHNAALLVHDDFFETPSRIDILKSLVATNAYAFYAELLKYACYKTPLSRIIIVYDDIEGIIETETMFLFVSQACRFHVCLLNTEDRNFSATSILSLRPSTRKILQETHWYHAYTANSQLIIDEPVALSEIFHARIEFLTKHDFRDRYADKERITDALRVLEKVLERFEARTLSIVALLSNYNIREALRLLATILANRKYVQSDAVPSAHFTIEPRNFVLNGGTIVKSLVYDESDVYFDHNPYVFNLFKNTANPTFDMVVPYFCKYFFFRNSQSWASLEKVKEDELLSDIKMICKDDTAINFALQYLLAEKVLEKHVVDDQSTTKTYYMALPRLFGIFRLMELNSVLFDALRDDLYLDTKSLQVSGVEGIQPIGRIGGADKKLQAAVQALKEILASETRLLNSINPKSRSVVQRKFGDHLVTGYAVRGLKTSSFTTTSDISKEIRQLERQATDFEKSYSE